MKDYFTKIRNWRRLFPLEILVVLSLSIVLTLSSGQHASNSVSLSKNSVTSPFREVKSRSEYANAAELSKPSAKEDPKISTATKEITNSRRNAIVQAVEKVEPAVVSVSVTQVRVYQLSPFAAFFNDPFFQQFFPELRQEYRQKVKAIGSGFIIDKKGHILTNEHVVHDAVKIVVNLPDGRQFNAKLLDASKALDVALLKIPGGNLPFVKLGNSDDILIGEWVIALGNPLGYICNDAQPTVTVGVISAKNRNFSPQEGRVYHNMIQTDASINPGNSGGPLVNALGEVIGINTFIFTRSGGAEGIGFAIPINRAKRVVHEILTHHKIRPFWTGLTIQKVDRLIAQSLGLESPQGVIVVEVAPKSPAQKAGLKVGDVILRVNDTPIEAEEQIQAIFAGGIVGDVFHLIVFRKGKRLKINITLEERPKR